MTLFDLNSLTSLDPKELDTKGSRYLYGSKIGDYQSCPRKAWFKHHLGVYPLEKPRYFTIGSALHKAAEIALRLGDDMGALSLVPDTDGGLSQLKAEQLADEDLSDINDLSETERSMVLGLYEIWSERWNEFDREIIAVEQTIKKELPPNEYFDYWTIKADQVFRDHEGLWNGDIKTTSGWGPSTASQYHNSLQTKCYGRVNKEHYPDLTGTKIFAVTKTKVPKCIEEPIYLGEDDYHQAEVHMAAAFQDCVRVETERDFSRRCTSCVNAYGHVCEYYNVCMAKQAINLEYVKEVLTTWFRQKDPDEHLELTDD